MGSGQSNSSGTIARIRGIGTGSDNPGFEAAVGIFIDGVYRARAGAALADLPDLERVEVLRGPQGTLFGRNTSAGAISVITAGPEFDPGMYLEGTAGFDDLEEVGARAGVNIPVSDTLAFRLDGSVRARDGYITDLIFGRRHQRPQTAGRCAARRCGTSTPTRRCASSSTASKTDEACCGITPLVYGTLASGDRRHSTTGASSATTRPTPRDRRRRPRHDRHAGDAGLPAMWPGLPAQRRTRPAQLRRRDRGMRRLRRTRLGSRRRQPHLDHRLSRLECGSRPGHRLQLRSTSPIATASQSASRTSRRNSACRAKPAASTGSSACFYGDEDARHDRHASASARLLELRTPTPSRVGATLAAARRDFELFDSTAGRHRWRRRPRCRRSSALLGLRSAPANAYLRRQHRRAGPAGGQLAGRHREHVAVHAQRNQPDRSARC